MSTRRWLDWRQANAVTVFGVQLMRRVAAELAAGNGVEPVHDWLEQSWHTRSAWPNRLETFMDPHGDQNCVVLVNRITYPARGTSDRLLDDVAPRVLEMLPFDMSLTNDERDEQMITPYRWKIAQGYPYDTASGKHRHDLREIAFTSPSYYCGYREAPVPSPFGTRHWPLNPDDEREPIVQDADPFRRIKQAEVPAVADDIVARVRAWGEYLGFVVGPDVVAGYRDENGTDWWAVNAPVSVVETPEEVARRAKPYVGRVAVRPGPREPRAPHIRGRTHFIVFHQEPQPFRVWITDPDADGKFVLTVRGPAA